MTEALFLGAILLLPFQFALNLAENVDLVTTKVLVPIVFCAWLIRGLSKKRIRLPSKMETWLIAVFLGLSGISLVLGRDWELGIRKTLYFLSVFPIFFISADLLENRSFRMKAVGAIIASGSLAALTGIIQFSLPFILGLDGTLKIWRSLAYFFLGNSFGKVIAINPSWLVNISGNTWMRAFGFFPDPHNFSFFVSLCFFVAIGYLFSGKNVAYRLAAGAGAGLMLLAIALSFSRGSYLGILAGIIFFTAFFLGRSGYLGKASVVLALFVALLFLIYPKPISQRLVSVFNLKEGSNKERMKNWEEAFGIILDHPLAGVGLGGYATTVDPAAEDRSSIYAHNIFLDIAAETGILNSLVFLILILTCAWRGITSKNFFGLGIASGGIYFLVHGIFDTPLWSPQVMVIFLVVVAMGMYSNKLKAQGVKLFAESGAVFD